jgi:hypothetical protein
MTLVVLFIEPTKVILGRLDVANIRNKTILTLDACGVENLIEHEASTTN